MTPFTVFGSGDFHHLTAIWLRQMSKPFTLISFDNHPDWDSRPPQWCCGTWVNRALELPNFRRAAIWGCGNFELNWPSYHFISKPDLDAGRLNVWPWTERLKPSGRRRWPGITRENWQYAFEAFVQELRGCDVYVTVDLDCLAEGESATNWEQGLFTVSDIAWALREIHANAHVAGADLCGAVSEPQYARWMQKLAANRDHPKKDSLSAEETRRRNQRAFETLVPILTGCDQTHADHDQQYAHP